MGDLLTHLAEQRRAERLARAARAAELRAEGMSAKEIAAELGVKHSTVKSYLADPDRAKQRAATLKRRVACENCGAPTSKETAPALCRACNNVRLHSRGGPGYEARAADQKARREKILALYQAGKTNDQIAAIFGQDPRTMASYISVMRKEGWDVPYRRSDLRGT